ncbi:MAG: hypothetical protein GY861_17030 [bacterium]|nr:hypothetical protein [bacterium]
MADNKLTIKDLQKAMDDIKESAQPNKTIKTDWGWVETDSLGWPIKIGLNGKYANAVKEICELPSISIVHKDLKIESFDGIPMVVDSGKMGEE